MGAACCALFAHCSKLHFMHNRETFYALLPLIGGGALLYT